MARIEAGKLHLEKRPWRRGDHRRRALGAGPALKGRPVAVDVPEGLPAAEADPSSSSSGQAVRGERAQVFARGSPLSVSAALKVGKS